MAKLLFEGSENHKNYIKSVDKIREYKKEISKKVSLANKRIRRLEANDLKDSPAYQIYLKEGGKPFSVRGKTFNELQHEEARLNKFINSLTSTVRGINKHLKDVAKTIGFEYKNIQEVRQNQAKFFQLAARAAELLDHIDNSAHAIGYQKIWESINTMRKAQEIELTNTTQDMDEMVELLVKKIQTEREIEFDIDNDNEWFSID